MYEGVESLLVMEQKNTYALFNPSDYDPYTTGAINRIWQSEVFGTMWYIVRKKLEVVF